MAKSVSGENLFGGEEAAYGVSFLFLILFTFLALALVLRERENSLESVFRSLFLFILISIK